MAAKNYDEIRQLIIDTLEGRPAGTMIYPEGHQEIDLSILDFANAILSVISTGIVGEAQSSTQPIQPSGSNAAYIFQVAPDTTKTFVNFRDSDGNVISVTTNSSQAAVGFLLWNGSYWSDMTVYIAVTSPAFETISNDIIQLLDGETPVYPQTKAEAVFLDNDPTKTLDLVLEENEYGGKVSSVVTIDETHTGNTINDNGICKNAAGASIYCYAVTKGNYLRITATNATAASFKYGFVISKSDIVLDFHIPEFGSISDTNVDISVQVPITGFLVIYRSTNFANTKVELYTPTLPVIDPKADSALNDLLYLNTMLSTQSIREKVRVNSWRDGYYVKYDTGSIVSKSGISAAAPIFCSGAQYLWLTIPKTAGSVNYSNGIAFYAEDGSYISGVEQYVNTGADGLQYALIPVPSTAKTFRVGVATADKTAFFAYLTSKGIPEIATLAPEVADLKKDAWKYKSIKEFYYKYTGKNLIDKNNLIYGMQIMSGNYVANAKGIMSNPLILKGGTTYTLSNVGFAILSNQGYVSIGFFDINDNYLGRTIYYNSSITVKSVGNLTFTFSNDFPNAAYVRICLQNSNSATIDPTNVQLELGSTATAYEAYSPSSNTFGIEDLALILKEQQLTPLQKSIVKGNIGVDTIKILAFGNSYTKDALSYMHKLLEAVDISVTIGIIFNSGASLQAYHDTLIPNNTCTTYYKIKNGIYTADNNATISDAVADEDWDIITLQQSSALSDDWTTYEPYLSENIITISEMLGKAAEFGFLLTTPHLGNDIGVTNFEGQATAAQNVLENTGCNFIIPCGTALQNLRTVALFNTYGSQGGMMSDDHLQTGIGMLVESYVYLGFLLRKMGKAVSIIGSPFRPTTGDAMTTHGTGVQGITDSNCETAQLAAIAAIKDPYNITDMN